MNPIRFSPWTVVAVLFDLALTACSGATADQPDAPSIYDVDPLFREFYEHLGGVPIMGAAISDRFSDGDIQYQYVQTALLVFNPSASAANRFQLAGIGRELGVGEAQADLPDNSLPNQVGIPVALEFQPLYERLGGVRFVGRPLTGLHYNPVIHRYEQYFENLGLYRLEADPPDQVRLLDYGAWMCGDRCRPVENAAGRIDPGNSRPAATPGADSLEIQAEAAYPSLPPDQVQTITVRVTRDGQPVYGVTPGLFLTLPEGERSYLLSPTDEQGQTTLEIEPFQAAPATLIPYRVCAASGNQPLCVQDSFVTFPQP